MSVSKNFKVALLIALCAYLPSNVFAWGTIGHRVVGQIAASYLTAKSRKAVQNILGTESLAMSSNWPDFIRSDSSYNYLSSWHYVNLPAGLDEQGVFSYLNTEKSANIYNKIPEMVAILKDKQSTLEQKRMALRLLVHLVGDLHQPMHTGRKDDFGGNRVNLFWFGNRSNLHHVWDESLVEYQQLSYTEYADAINHPTKAQLTAWRKTSLQQDVFESYQIVNKIYDSVKPDEKLSYKYNFDFVDTLNQQLLKGGVRLAEIINEIYS
jgi:hypothetical protein